jgi:hypothetical protein
VCSLIPDELDDLQRADVIAVHYTRVRRCPLYGTPRPAEIAGVPRFFTRTVLGQRARCEYYDGAFAPSVERFRGAAGPVRRWTRANHHTIVAYGSDFSLAVRGPRRFGVEEFHLLAVADGLDLLSFGGER